ncbi:MAG: (d)CMP kinase [Limnochordia bacterium]|nr:(d)CMP kinase [Limnochordia bacterium]MDI9464309.1 (d)CMP kinase [Bacillota bacterium]NLO94849.1 (d)CMP kinase [Bacillota bacterium]HAI52519.1 (d)CMP kinase [Bacillota bacterium]HOB40249.1 (d)CMP kinase [Limnochordia bacterium]
MKIAIDGPAGAGKSTIARLVAKRLGLRYLDTGAMYRALTLAALERGVPCTDEEALLRVATSVDLEIVFDEETKGNRVYLDGQDVTDLIRRPEVNAYVSLVSSHKKVRDFIVALQKEIARRGCIVMDGRDIGTVVMPDADWKIFLHASVEERARRRLRELRRNGHDVDLQELAEQIRQRDHFDSTRAISPLRKAEDAVEVDTTHLNIEEVVARVLAIIKGEA